MRTQYVTTQKTFKRIKFLGLFAGLIMCFIAPVVGIAGHFDAFILLFACGLVCQFWARVMKWYYHS